MSAILLTGDRYKVDSLYQWDKDQDLVITGLSLPFKPEIHFTNANMDRAIVRQSETDPAGIITVKIPNALLQVATPISVYVCGYEGNTFKTYHSFLIPVIGRDKPADYSIKGDEDIYSFTELEYKVNNFNDNILKTVQGWIRDNLSTADSGYILDAKQGRILLDRIYNEEVKVGSLATLNTEDKSSIVKAINSVVNSFRGVTGNLPDLATSVTSSLVGAINSLVLSFREHKKSGDHDDRYYTESEIDTYDYSVVFI